MFSYSDRSPVDEMNAALLDEAEVPHRKHALHTTGWYGSLGIGQREQGKAPATAAGGRRLAAAWSARANPEAGVLQDSQWSQNLEELPTGLAEDQNR